MKEDSKHSVLIFAGSSLIAKGLVLRLNELGIMPIEKNDMQSAIRTGFAIVTNEQVRLFIRKDELELAKNTIDEYLKEISQEE